LINLIEPHYALEQEQGRKTRCQNALDGERKPVFLPRASAHLGTAANVADVNQLDQLLHGEETFVISDAGCTGVDKRTERQSC
jgi:IS5 family transposase